MTEIYIADWIFYSKIVKVIKIEGSNKIQKPAEIISESVVTKKIPLEFLLNDKLTYLRAIKKFSVTELGNMIEDKKTGLKKFKINYIKPLGIVFNDNQGLDEFC